MSVFATLPSPLGSLRVQCSNSGIESLQFDDSPLDHTSIVPDFDASELPSDFMRSIFFALNAYFSGNAKAFDLPLCPSGTTFQHSVWNELLKIPYGKTRTYDQIGWNLGKEGAARAVGAANAANPIAIIIPCHRVIAADGSLHGYAGGLERKKKLLQIEGVISNISLFDGMV